MFGFKYLRSTQQLPVWVSFLPINYVKMSRLSGQCATIHKTDTHSGILPHRFSTPFLSFPFDLLPVLLFGSVDLLQTMTPAIASILSGVT